MIYLHELKEVPFDAWGGAADPPPKTDPDWPTAAPPPNAPNPAPPLGATEPNVAPANNILICNRFVNKLEPYS